VTHTRRRRQTCFEFLFMLIHRTLPVLVSLACVGHG
jgi:hypothetical protein